MSTIVISLGGSVLCPDGRGIDVRYAKDFLRTITRNHHRFIVVCGGGTTARSYSENLKGFTRQATDRICIAVTKLHARCLYEVAVHEGIKAQLVETPQQMMPNTTLTILGGTTPGHTTDFVAVQAAQHNNASCLINISNTPGVFTADPSKTTGKPAMLIPALSWVELTSMLAKKFTTGMHTPFDPQAIRLAQQQQITCLFIGKENLDALLAHNVFKGTLVQ